MEEIQKQGIKCWWKEAWKINVNCLLNQKKNNFVLQKAISLNLTLDCHKAINPSRRKIPTEKEIISYLLYYNNRSNCWLSEGCISSVRWDYNVIFGTEVGYIV